MMTRHLSIPAVRHSGEGRNPAKPNTPHSGQQQGIAPLARDWIPAFAGMTVLMIESTPWLRS
jgi:hypothetical protein